MKRAGPWRGSGNVDYSWVMPLLSLGGTDKVRDKVACGFFMD